MKEQPAETAAVIGIPSLPIAAVLISLTMSATLVIVWLILPRFGGFGAEVPIGWQN